MYNQNMYYPANMPAAQQRLQMLEQQNPQLAQQYSPGFQPQQMQQMQQVQPMQQAQQQPQQQGIKCFQVTSIDEAKAYMVDFDGTLTVFINAAQGQIYTKQLGLNGLANFEVYNIQPKQAQVPQMVQQQAPAVNVDALKNDFVSVNDYKTFQQDVYNKLSKLSETMTNIDNALGGLQNE